MKSKVKMPIKLIATEMMKRLNTNSGALQTAEYLAKWCNSKKVLLSDAATDFRIWADSLPRLDERTALRLAELIVAITNIIYQQEDELSSSKPDIKTNKEATIAELLAVTHSDLSSLLPQAIISTSNNPINGLVQLIKYSTLSMTQHVAIKALTTFPKIERKKYTKDILGLIDSANINILPEILRLSAELDRSNTLPYMIKLSTTHSSNERIISTIINSLVQASSRAEFDLLREIALDNIGYLRELALDHLSIGLLSQQELMLDLFSLDNLRDAIDLLDMFLWYSESQNILGTDLTKKQVFARITKDFPGFIKNVDTLREWGEDKGRLILNLLTVLHQWKNKDTDGANAVELLKKVSDDLQENRLFGFSSTVLEFASTMQPHERLRAYISLAPLYENPDERKKLIDALVDLIESLDTDYTFRAAQDSVKVKEQLSQIANELGDTNQGDTLRKFITNLSQDSTFQVIRNPYIVGKPIEDPKMFVGRGIIFRKIEFNFFGEVANNILLLYGERRMGKTSILKQMRHRFPDRVFSIFIDMQGLYPAVESMTSEDDFFDAISTEICRELSFRKIDSDSLLQNKPQSKLYPWFRDDFIPFIQSRTDNRSILLMLDEFGLVLESIEKKKLPLELLSHLRHLMQHMKDLDFILAGTSDLLELAQNQKSILFNLPIPMKVSFLDRESSIKLITDPVRPYNMDYDPEVITAIIEMTGGHPYLIQFVCNEMVDLHNQKRRNRISLDFLQEVSEQIMDQCAFHFQFLRNQASTEERALLSYLTISESPLLFGEILIGIKSTDSEISEEAVSNAILSLEAKDLIKGNKSNGYKLAVGLMRNWLIEQQF